MLPTKRVQLSLNRSTPPHARVKCKGDIETSPSSAMLELLRTQYVEVPDHESCRRSHPRALFLRVLVKQKAPHFLLEFIVC